MSSALYQPFSSGLAAPTSCNYEARNYQLRKTASALPEETLDIVHASFEDETQQAKPRQASLMPVTL